jgi:S1-C subfamily serine protease
VSEIADNDSAILSRASASRQSSNTAERTLTSESIPSASSDNESSGKEEDEASEDVYVHPIEARGQYIRSVDMDGPAHKSGLKAGDRIVAVNGKVSITLISYVIKHVLLLAKCAAFM